MRKGSSLLPVPDPTLLGHVVPENATSSSYTNPSMPMQLMKSCPGKLHIEGLLSSQGHEDTDLMDVLAEGRHRGELADEVQVGRPQCIESAAVICRQVLFIDLGHILNSQHQADEVYHHLLIGQLDADERQQAVESLVVLLYVGFLLTAQVDVSVELLGVLEMGMGWGQGGNRRGRRMERKTV